MSDRIDFYGVYENAADNDEAICLCITEARAQAIMNILQATEEYEDEELEIRHVEIIAEVDLRFAEY